MPETARFPSIGLLIAAGAVLAVAFGIHSVGSVVLTIVGVGLLAKWAYRWHFASTGQPWPTAWASCAGGWRRDRRTAAAPSASGNHAFDEYCLEMLRRLEQDHQDFQSFLDRLRRAKDKTEFDQFMADRGRPAPESRPETDRPENGRPSSPWPNA